MIAITTHGRLKNQVIMAGNVPDLKVLVLVRFAPGAMAKPVPA